MIRNQWYVIEESRRIKKGKTLSLNRLGEDLVLWRTNEGNLVCMKRLCPHLGADLGQATITADKIVCAFHGFQYAQDGQCCLIPALGNGGKIPHSIKARTYPVYEQYGLVWMYWGKNEPPAEPPLFFPSIADNFPYITFRQKWNVHYSRMVENQLDVMHLPFVHHNTIGAGGRYVVDGPYIRLENDLLDLWVFNRKDDGRPARRASELPAPYGRPQLQFRFPNLWQNWISDNTRITIAFVPVDQTHTIMMGRFYNRSVKIPGLRELFLLIGKLSSHIIANQDRKIINRQLPKRSDFRGGEKPVFTDNGILTYRKRRFELINQEPVKVEKVDKVDKVEKVEKPAGEKKQVTNKNVK